MFLETGVRLSSAGRRCVRSKIAYSMPKAVICLLNLCYSSLVYKRVLCSLVVCRATKQLQVPANFVPCSTVAAGRRKWSQPDEREAVIFQRTA